MKDWRGTEIFVGSHVVYPGRQGSSIWMTEGEVVELRSRIEDRWNFDVRDRVPTEIGTVVVRRLRTTSWREIVEDDKKPKTYSVMIDRVTVVE